MDTLTAIDSAFSFVKPGHPLGALVERARGFMHAEPCAGMILRIATGKYAVTTRTLLKWKRRDLRWFYFLIQSEAKEKPIADRALTIFYRPDQDRLVLHPFPQDPYLPSIPAYLEQLLGDDHGRHNVHDFTVLRYVPRRRLTYRIPDSGGTGGFQIGKFVRRSEIGDAYDKLGRVSDAVEQQRPLFAVSTPLGMNETHGVFYQTYLEGQNLADLIQEENFVDLLFTVGRIHWEIHQLRVPGVPQWQFNSIAKEIKERVAIISYLCPEMALFLEDIHANLNSRLPTNPQEFTFCHGDFGCTQLLTQRDQWSVIDFDRCLYSDRYREIAQFLVFLKHNVPFFFQAYRDPARDADALLKQASDSYFRGYQSHSKEPLNRMRLLWYQIASEIHYLARMLQRDLHHPVAFERTVYRIKELTAHFKSDNGGNW